MPHNDIAARLAQGEAALEATLAELAKNAREDDLRVLRALAEKLGYRLIKEDVAVELSLLTEWMFLRAKQRQEGWGHSTAHNHLLDLNHARDDLADLREELARADVINPTPKNEES